MLSWKPEPSRVAPPYDVLARIYDYVMRHVDYVEWADYVEAAFRRYGPPPRRVLEVACGTGTLAIDLVARGYAVHGMDLSAAMIERAEEKAGKLSSRPDFSVGDMRDLPPGDADALLCLYDSINYNLTHDDLRRTIASFRRPVLAGALCIFDVTTESNSLRYFRHYRTHERWRGFVYRRTSRYLEDERLQINEFVIREDGSHDETAERHEQRIFSMDEIYAAIPTDRWEVLGAFDDYTFDPATEDSDRIHYVLRAR